jgi:hypothetical protein
MLDIFVGSQVLNCLENGVCQWPKLEGRFPQVSGIRFAFDGQKDPGERINQEYVKIGDEYLHLGEFDYFYLSSILTVSMSNFV